MVNHYFKLGRQKMKKNKSNLKYNIRLISFAIIMAFVFLGLVGFLNPAKVFKAKAADSQKKVIILGFDGMDPNLTAKWMDEGKLPNFKRLKEMGDFKPLFSSIPPQSPVAWSNFITGMNPGGHGIYDFLIRVKETYFPDFSTAKVTPPKHTLKLGKWIIPLSGGKAENMRKGAAWWQILEEHKIPATVYRVPSNFPPVETKQRTFSGMGVPDLQGSQGTFSFYTTTPYELKADISGGDVYEVQVKNNIVKAQLVGPKNTMRKDEPDVTVDFTVYVDPDNRIAKIEIQDNEIMLKEKEWSKWVQVKFKLMPLFSSVTGIVRFYMKEISPEFKLYVTPINIDPSNPALPICTPKKYAKELYKKFGYFYTQNMPEDTKALEHGILSEDEFLQQLNFVLAERMKICKYELERFKEGALFCYFSTTDQGQHMYWRTIDPQHPAYTPELGKKYGNVILGFYQAMDKALGMALDKKDDNTIIMVVSDHGFNSFRRAFNLDSWLKENGYVTLVDEWRQGETEFFLNVDWSGTKAYALGFNSLYVNQMGREKYGIVQPGPEKEALLNELVEKLEKVIDPKTGERVITKVYKAEDCYQGSEVENAPDLIIGYNKGYRASWQTALGKFPKVLLEDNTDKWSGDHLIDMALLPGILFCSEKVTLKKPALYDIAPTILKIYGIKIPKDMVGKPLF
jgi:predicted AlkP superfamily phosphohydrolase/phosphomutase